jgi:hypothetical protein
MNSKIELRTLAASVEPSPDAFDSLVRRIQREEKRGRRLAGVVGLCVALAGSGWIYWGLVHSSSISHRPAQGHNPTPLTVVSPTTAPASGVYPRGAFDWCPVLQGTLPFTGDAAAQAADTAIAFNSAVDRHDQNEIGALVDPSANPDPSFWGSTGTMTGVKARASERADYEASHTFADLVLYGCGPEVLSASWHVELTDASGSASAGVVEYWLVLRADGWKVWGSY